MTKVDLPVGFVWSELYTTCPSSTAADPDRSYRERMLEVARWTEESGLRGLLVYSDNSLADPWLVAQLIVTCTAAVPLVAVQPLYSHPYTIAKKVATLALLHDRVVDLNMVSGGFVRNFAELGDRADREQRYERLAESTEIVRSLLTNEPVTWHGRHYEISRLVLEPRLVTDSSPRFFMSGSSAASVRAARALRVQRLFYPPPPAQIEAGDEDEAAPTGIRIGIIARASADDAWQVAHERFPVDPQGAALHRLAARISGSSWQETLSATQSTGSYWLHPFHTYRTFCPYLVGSYDDVGSVLAAYLRVGVRTLILDAPTEVDDLWHARVAVERSRRQLPVTRSSEMGSSLGG